MWRDLGVAVALVLVIEGILPFLNPAGLRRMFAAVQEMSDRQLRVAGLASMLVGLILLTLINHQ
jgi:uncharacterized protein YjeT (DUF2065 family)